MKRVKNIRPETNRELKQGFEVLSGFEMHRIRGGGSEDKIKTKEIDVYITRED